MVLRNQSLFRDAPGPQPLMGAGGVEGVLLQKQAADLRMEAMHQRDRFGRDMLAKELESAAASIEDLEEKLEAQTDGEPGI